MRERRRRHVILGIWLVWLSLLTAISLASANSVLLQLVSRLPLSDGTLHLLAYTGSSCLPVIAMPTARRALIAGSLMAPLGLVLELAQAALPGRSTDEWDLAANGLGVAIGLLLGWWVRQALRAVLARLPSGGHLTK